MRNWYVAASILPLVLAVAAPVYAADEGAALDEIIVTAQKRAESLQDTPIAMAALSGEDLRAASKNEFESLLQTAPAVRISNQPAGTQVYMRGLGPAVTTDASVSLNFDGVYQADPMIGRIYDISRVEVLRGPQGTLYGRNATGGSVNFITGAPNLEDLTVYGSVQVGNYQARRLEGTVNLPIVADKVALRAAFASSEHDPYVTNGGSAEDVVSGRLKLLVQPTDAIKVLLSASYTRADNTPPGTVSLPLSSHAGNPWFSTVRPGLQKYRRTDFSAQTEIDLGFANLIWIPSYSRDNNRWDQDVTGTNTVSAAGGLSVVHTEEVRLASNPDSAISWLVGAFYFNRDYHRNRRLVLSSQPRTPIAYPFVDTILQTSTSKALFGQATAPINDKLRVTVGLRYSEDEPEQFAQAFSKATTALPISRTTKTKFDATNWKLGVEYDLTPDNLLYATVSTGYKSGGLNEARPALVAGAIPRPSSFSPEEVTAYEAGSKNQFGSLRLNVAGYYYDYQNQQILNANVVSGIVLREVLNAAQSTIYGAEMDFRYSLGPDTHIYGDVAYTKSKYDRLAYFSLVNPILVPGAGTTLDYSGHRQVQAPEWSGSIGAEHNFEIGEGRLTVSGEVHFYSDYLAGLEPTPLNEQSAYTSSDARVTYTAPNGKVSVTGFVNNIEDDGTLTSTLISGVATRRAYLSTPRTYGLRLAVNY